MYIYVCVCLCVRVREREGYLHDERDPAVAHVRVYFGYLQMGRQLIAPRTNRETRVHTNTHFSHGAGRKKEDGKFFPRRSSSRLPGTSGCMERRLSTFLPFHEFGLLLGEGYPPPFCRTYPHVTTHPHPQNGFSLGGALCVGVSWHAGRYSRFHRHVSARTSGSNLLFFSIALEHSVESYEGL